MKIISFIIILLSLNIESFSQEQLLKIKSNLPINIDQNELTIQDHSFEKKSAGLAILYSMLLPGMGELYAGDYSTGKYFTIADGIIWSTFTGMTIYGNNKEDDYKSFAKVYGEVNVENKDDEYFANIGIYENIEQYNREKELNRQFDEVYSVESHFWSWNNNDQRKEYRSLWSSSENAKNNLRFAVGALVLNRLISAIFAVRAVSAHNKRESISQSWNLNFNLRGNHPSSDHLVMNLNFTL